MMKKMKADLSFLGQLFLYLDFLFDYLNPLKDLKLFYLLIKNILFPHNIDIFLYNKMLILFPVFFL